MDTKKIPTIGQADKLLLEASELNPGPWIEHSRFTALAAKYIAAQCDDIDEDTAYIVGLLHDIGRRFGMSHLKHVLDGYHFLSAAEYSFAAQIALTHSFPTKTLKSYFGTPDCSEKDKEFIYDYLQKTEYTVYDRLIQLCDALALPMGFCLLEKRMVDVVLRNGPSECMQEKWCKTFEIKAEFEEKIGASIYSVLPGTIENTFRK